MEFIAECDKHMLPTELCNIKYSLPLINSHVIEVSNKNISKLKKIKSINALYPNKTIDTQMNIVRDKVKCINTKYTPGSTNLRVPLFPSVSFHSIRWLRNFNRMCIDYASRPRLSSRLTLGGRTFPRKP